MKKIILLILMMVHVSAFSKQATSVTLDAQWVRLSDVIYTLAKQMNMNVLVSPTIQSRITLHVQEVNPKQLFQMLLEGNELASLYSGKLTMVMPRESLIKMKQEIIKLQAAEERSAPLLVEFWQLQYAEANELARLLRQNQQHGLSARGQVRVDTRTNTLIVRDTDKHIRLAHRLVERLDVPVKQIRIETKLITIDSDFKHELGIQFSNQPRAHQAGGRGYSVAIARLPDGSSLDVTLSALENAGHAELISTPSLFTSNQQTASIEAGEEVPYQEVSESGGTAVAFKKAVLGLSVTPQLLPNNAVLLKLHINQDRPSQRMVLGVPTISTRQMTTQVLVQHGQTVVLGGIYEKNEEQSSEALPFISQVPLIGELFKHRSTRRSKRELLIFVTPKVIQ